MIVNVDQGLNYLKKGEIVAYPTEAVYGLGCLAFEKKSVLKLLKLKSRPMEKGFIVLINELTQLWPLVSLPQDFDISPILSTWPGPITWVFPANQQLPFYLKGKHQSIAIRMSAHPVAEKLCAYGPIISTSANISGQNPMRSCSQLQHCFKDIIIIEGALGNEPKPTPIYNALTKACLRS